MGKIILGLHDNNEWMEFCKDGDYLCCDTGSVAGRQGVPCFRMADDASRTQLPAALPPEPGVTNNLAEDGTNIQKDIHDAYYHLKQGTYRDRGGFHEYRRERSLIDSVAREYLSETSEELATESPGAGWGNIEDQENLFLRAAKALMYTPAVAGGNEHGLHGLFDACNNLSTLKYEGKEGVGRLVFARPDHPRVQRDVTLTRPVPLRSVGAVRKLLQMASGHLALLCDSIRSMDSAISFSPTTSRLRTCSRSSSSSSSSGRCYMAIIRSCRFAMANRVSGSLVFPRNGSVGTCRVSSLA